MSRAYAAGKSVLFLSNSAKKRRIIFVFAKKEGWQSRIMYGIIPISTQKVCSGSPKSFTASLSWSLGLYLSIPETVVKGRLPAARGGRLLLSLRQIRRKRMCKMNRRDHILKRKGLSRRLLSVLLTLVMLLSMLPQVVFAADPTPKTFKKVTSAKELVT